MPLPGGTETVVISEQYLNSQGKPEKGIITFRPTVYTTGGSFIVPSSTIRVSLNSQGSFSVDLPTSVNPELTPDGWTYEVNEMLLGGQYRRYSIVVPSSNEEIRLGDLAPVGENIPPGNYATVSQLSFVFQQASLSDTWVIDHPLPYHPSVVVEDSTGDVVEGAVSYPTMSRVEVRFSRTYSGRAFLS